MELLAAAGRAVEDAEVDHFTGAATMQRFLGSGPDAAGRVYRVAFEPGAGTNWHTHSDVQILYVVEGRCAIQSWGGAVQVAEAGDVVRFEPGEKHWHGAHRGRADDPHRDQPRRVHRVARSGHPDGLKLAALTRTLIDNQVASRARPVWHAQDGCVPCVPASR